jgi:hypothetical protein
VWTDPASLRVGTREDMYMYHVHVVLWVLDVYIYVYMYTIVLVSGFVWSWYECIDIDSEIVWR